MKKYTFLLTFAVIATIVVLTILYIDKIPEEYVYGSIIAFFATALILFFLYPEDFVENTKRKNEEKFLKAVEKILSSDSVNLDDIFLLGEYYKLENKEIEKLLLSVFSSKIEIDGINANTTLIKKTITDLKLNEPFANLPESMRIHLLQLYHSDNNQKETTRMLASSITDFIIKGDRLVKKERNKSTFGIILTVIGLVLTIYFSVKHK